MAKRAATVVGRMKKMHPTDFENLAYDLLFLSGIRNLKWRTPGSDGGRDLEGEFTSPDFSGDYVPQKWYIECKRYGKSIDWPTVHEKLSVAMNHKADFLLFVTTANFSTQCRDEVDRHNERKSSPLIRIWPFYTLEHLLSVHGQLSVKYGLRQAKEVLPVDFKTILAELNKLAQSTHAAAVFGENTINRVELLAAVTELIEARMLDVVHHGRFVSKAFNQSRDSFDWCFPNPLPVKEFDRPSLRAALSTIKVVSGDSTISCSVQKDTIRVSVNGE
ncbi:hypothetical protein ACVMIH_002238 [Bradyrhizobium sp. USDA 4503]